MKKHHIFASLFLVVCLLILVSVQYLNLALGDAVTVSATVSTSVSCSTATTTSAFGTLTIASVFTSTPNVTSTMSCNYGAGCTLSVLDAGSGANPGLWNASASSLIKSPDASYIATSTLAAATEGYGLQATTTAAGSGATLGIATRYNQTGNTVGGLTTSNQTIVSSTLPISGREVVVTHKAAIAGLTAAGSYTDTITYSCTGN